MTPATAVIDIAPFAMGDPASRDAVARPVAAAGTAVRRYLDETAALAEPRLSSRR